MKQQRYHFALQHLCGEVDSSRAIHMVDGECAFDKMTYLPNVPW